MEEKRLSSIKGFIFSRSFIWTVRTIIALIFIYSGVVKFLNLYEFGEVISRYHILPQGIEIPFASLIVAAEIILGLLFILGVYEKETGVFLILLNIVFIFAMFTAIVRGIDTSCGCFSKEGDVLGLKDIVRDIVFILMIIIVIYGRKYGNRYND